MSAPSTTASVPTPAPSAGTLVSPTTLTATTGKIELKEVFSILPSLAEQAATGCKITPLSGGRFKVRAKGQHCEVTNRNMRKYPTESTWGKHTKPDAAFIQRVKSRRVIGQLEHPESGRSSMGLAAVVITEVSPPNEKGEVFIEFETMSTPGGMIVASFVRDGVGFGISSRGNGSVLRIEGIDVVQDDFEPVTFDLVVDESTPGAEVIASKVKEACGRAVAVLMEAVHGDEKKAAEIAEAQTRVALARDILGETMPPRGDSEYLFGIDDGSAHYRAYDNGVGQWDVWFEPHNLDPVRIATAMPTMKNARGAAEEHLRLVVGKDAPGTPAMAVSRAAPAGSAPKVIVNVESAPATRQKPTHESYVVADGLPFNGTMLTLEFDTAKETEDAGECLADGAGFDSWIDGTELVVYVPIGDPDQALAQVRRCLVANDIGMAEQGEGALIRNGKIIREARFMATNVTRTARSESESGRDAPAGAGEYTAEVPTGSEIRTPMVKMTTPKAGVAWEDDDKAKDKDEDDKEKDKDEADSDKEKDEAEDDDKKKDKAEADKDDDKDEADDDKDKKDEARGRREGVSVPTSGEKGNSKTWRPASPSATRNAMPMPGNEDDDDYFSLDPDGDGDIDLPFDMEDPAYEVGAMAGVAQPAADAMPMPGMGMGMAAEDDDKDKDEWAVEWAAANEADDKEKDKDEADDDKKDKKETSRTSEARQPRMTAVEWRAYEKGRRTEAARHTRTEADDKDKDAKKEADDDKAKKDKDEAAKRARREADDKKDKDEKRGKREADDKEKKERKKAEARARYEGQVAAAKRSYISEIAAFGGAPGGGDAGPKTGGGSSTGGYGANVPIDDPEDLDHNLDTSAAPGAVASKPKDKDPNFASGGMTKESVQVRTRSACKTCGSSAKNVTEALKKAACPTCGQAGLARPSAKPVGEAVDHSRCTAFQGKARQKVKFLESEIARLESTNAKLTSLVERMTAVQAGEQIKTKIAEVVAAHPELGSAKVREKLAKCSSPQAVLDEAAALMGLLRESRKTLTALAPAALVEAAPTPPPAAPTPAAPKPAPSPHKGTAVPSASIENAPTGPLTEDSTANLLGTLRETMSTGGDEASRVAEHRRRQRRARGQS